MKGNVGGRIFSAALLIASLALPIPVSVGSIDGSGWRTLDGVGKISYAAGLLDGAATLSWMLVGNDDRAQPIIASGIILYVSGAIAKVSVGQLRDGLDVFFDDYRNRAISVPEGALVVILQINGKPDEDINRLVLRLREAAR